MLQPGPHPHFLHKKSHEMNLKFSHKNPAAASGVVVLAFALFTLYNDYLQRNTIRQNLESSVQQAGDLTASSVQNWMKAAACWCWKIRTERRSSRRQCRSTATGFTPRSSCPRTARQLAIKPIRRPMPAPPVRTPGALTKHESAAAPLLY